MEMRHLAGAERIGDRDLVLCPVHIFRLKNPAHPFDRQYKKAGTPASRMAKPMVLLTGLLATVATTTAAQASTNRPVVNGWPGARKPSAPSASRLRNTNKAAPVSANQMKSTDTT